MIFSALDILKVIEESRINGFIHPSFNATFIALIPKQGAPESLDDYRPISLCNCIYKIIAKGISRRIKGILSNKISQEQFGFLEGRQIHEAIGVSQEDFAQYQDTEAKRGSAKNRPFKGL
jgi:hypothetical protein